MYLLQAYGNVYGNILKLLLFDKNYLVHSDAWNMADSEANLAT